MGACPERSRRARPRVGISSCLLGFAVRHDGGHKRDSPLLESLGPLVEWVPVCPEIEIGLGTPRPAIDLQETRHGIRLVMPETGRDLTIEMQKYAERQVAALAAMGISGYVLKSKSPSCGLGSTRVCDESGALLHRHGTGLFAALLTAQLPDLPVEEEASLADAACLSRFIERVRAYRPAAGT